MTLTCPGSNLSGVNNLPHSHPARSGLSDCHTGSSLHQQWAAHRALAVTTGQTDRCIATLCDGFHAGLTGISVPAQADKIKKPLLLIHGEDDDNSGTFPLQSERLYAALKGHGAPTRLVLLPHESHGYRAAESVMHALYEMDAWLEAWCGADVTSKM